MRQVRRDLRIVHEESSAVRSVPTRAASKYTSNPPVACDPRPFLTDCLWLQVFDDPQVRHNGTIVPQHHPVGGRFVTPKPPAVFHGTPSEIGAPAPLLVSTALVDLLVVDLLPMASTCTVHKQAVYGLLVMSMYGPT